MYEHKVLSISKLQSGLSCQETKLKIIVINKKFKSTKIRGALVNKVSSMASKLTEKLKVRKSVQGNYVAESQKLYCTAPNMRVNNSVLESGSRTNFDNEIPRSGSEWNEYLKGKYGADNVHWNINFVDDIFSDPTYLKGYTVDELFDAYRNAYKGLDDIKVDVKSPNGDYTLGIDVTPYEAVDLIQKWLKDKKLY